jgi:hypothetical protein
MKLAVLAVLALAHRVDAKGCHETSYVVGFEHCSEFAEWSRDFDWPRIAIEFGGFDHRFESDRFALGSPDTSGEPAALHTNVTGTMLHIAVGLGPVIYVGGDVQGGGASIVSSLRGLPPDASFYVATHAIAGLHTELAHIELGAELAAGVHLEQFSVCTVGTDKCMNDISDTQTGFDLELRARVAMYVANHVSIGVMYSHSVVDTYDHMLVATLALHVRTLDGM